MTLPDRVLVTGGAGFVGANLVRRLSGRCAVRVLDSGVGGAANVLPADVELITADIRDGDAVRRAADGVGAVVHLAAAGNVVESVRDPHANFDVNVRGSLSVLDAARDADVERIVVASTGGALMGNAPGPVHEGSVPRPLSPYGASKAAMEAYCHAYAGSYGLRSVILRFANLYGPFSGHKKGVVTTFFRALHRGEPLTIFGDGEQTRDFVNVADVVQANLRAGDSRGVSGAFNIGSGTRITINHLVTLLREASGLSPVVRHGPPRAGDVRDSLADISAARDAFGFAPSGDMRAGLAEYWAWAQTEAASPAR